MVHKLADCLPSSRAKLFSGSCVFLIAFVLLCSTSALAELTLWAPQYGDCGQITINGYVSGGPASITWDWGDGTVTQAWFPATHEYSSNDTYTVTVTAQPSGDSDHATVTITNANTAGCDCSVRLKPSAIVLRDGTTSDRFEVEIRDETGEVVSTQGVSITFASSDPGLASIDVAGNVSSTGFGEALVTATIDGYREASGKVYAGSFRVSPPILLLSLEPGLDTGTLSAEILNADGTPVNLTGKTLMFEPGNHVALVNPSTGTVTALSPPVSFGDTPGIHAILDGVYSNNASIVRVTQTTLGLTPSAHPGGNVDFWFPPEVTGHDYAQIYVDHDIGQITDWAYDFELELTEVVTFRGDTQFLVNDLGHGTDGTVPCGLSGNPVRLGTDVDKTVHNSCFIVAFPPETPQWGVYFHEMGHNCTWQSRKFANFANAGSSNSNFTFSEGLATACGIYVAQRLDDESGTLGISESAVAQIKQSVGYFNTWNHLADYVTAGADYSSIDPNILDDMLSTLAHEYGFESLYRFYSLFLSQHEGLPIGISSDTEQATVFIAAMSIATGADLRSRFHDDWGFPLDNAYYAQIYAYVRRLVLQRGPEVRITEGTPAVFRVDFHGTVYANGTFYGQSFETGSADVAEWVSVSGPVEPGDVLELDPNHPGQYRKACGPCSDLVAGVVSTKPGFVLGSEVQGFGIGVSGVTVDSQLPTVDSALLALIGIVPVKVTNEGGPIQPGDLLVTSSTPGYAMRWNPDADSPCDLVGKALEPMMEEEGMILVLLTAH